MKKSPFHKQNKKELQPFYTYLRQTEKRRKQEYSRFSEALSESLQIPGDVLAGAASICMTGRHSIHVTNYKSIDEYTKEQIGLSLKGGKICITGRNLSIEYFRKEEIKISGLILSVSFL